MRQSSRHMWERIGDSQCIGSAVALPTLAKCANKFIGFVRNDLIKEGVEDIEIVFHVGRSALIIGLLPKSCEFI